VTHFSDLYSPTRTFLGDISAIPMYSEDQLDLGIESALLLSNGEFSEGPEDSGERTITPDLTGNAKARLAIMAAIALLSPASGAMSYRTKVLSVTRENGRAGHLGWLESQLHELTNGSMAVASETEWDQFLRGSAEAISKLNSFPT